MKNLLYILFLFSCLSSFAQNVASGEYFVDTDPGYGNGTALPAFAGADTVDLTYNVDVTGLSTGFHRLYTRFKSSTGTWGMYEGRSFYITAAANSVNQTELAEAEYFIDTDPGYGNGTALPSFTAADTVDLISNIDVTGISTGFHRLYIRFKNDNGTWGMYEGRSFYITPSASANNTALLTSAEYFFNSDPGYGNGIALPAFSPADTVDILESIDVTALAVDTEHHLYIRFKNENGVWGMYEGRAFTRLSCTVATVDYTASSTNICEGETVSFTDNSTDTETTSTYAWDFNGDGEEDDNTIGGLDYTFLTPGVFEVELKITNGECIDSISKTITVNNIDTVNVNADICFNGSYTFADGTEENNITANLEQTSVIAAVSGCDSVIVTSLTVLDPLIGTDTQIACGTFTWIDGNEYTASNNSATFTVQNADGCDSIVTLDLTINPTFTLVDVQTHCDSYTWSDGNTYTTSNNTATQVLQTVNGCDSTVTLNLTILESTSGTDVQIACGSYTWIDGIEYTSDNNSATFTLTNAAGCDSVVTLNLTILNTLTSTDVQSACESYDWIDGNTYTSSNNSATFTLTSVQGCDSIVTLDLTILEPTSGTDTQVHCDSYTWIDGNEYTASNTTATHTLTNVAGCDSIVTLNLTINNSVNTTDEQVHCNAYTWADGITYTESNTTATQTLQTVNGCDSIVTLNLTINTDVTGIDVQSACSDFTWIDGNTYTESNNTATFTLTSAAGCDSLVTLDLTIGELEAIASVTDFTATVNLAGLTYQWIDCADNSEITGATAQDFTPTENGSYACIVTDGDCETTSNCVTIAGLGFEEAVINGMEVFPNPFSSNFTIVRTETSEMDIRITDAQGKTVYSGKSKNLKTEIDGSSFVTGIYLVSLTNNETTTTYRIIKK